MKNLTKEEIVKEKIVNSLIEYTAGTTTDTIRSMVGNDEIKDILAEFLAAWKSAECDAEGATAEQNAKLDRILDDAAGKIMEELNYN